MKSIAKVASIKGEATVSINNHSVELHKGSEIPLHATIVTKGESHVEIKFEDNTVVAMGPNSKLVVDDYIYNPTNKNASNLLLEMGKGIFRTVTGKIAEQNPDNFKLKSPLATIGIRGTVVLSEIRPDGTEKHGCEAITKGHVLVISDHFGNVRFITQPLSLVSLSKSHPLGEVHKITPQELHFFETAAPITSVVIPSPHYGPAHPQQKGGEHPPAEHGESNAKQAPHNTEAKEQTQKHVEHAKEQAKQATAHETGTKEAKEVTKTEELVKQPHTVAHPTTHNILHPSETSAPIHPPEATTQVLHPTEVFPSTTTTTTTSTTTSITVETSTAETSSSSLTTQTTTLTTSETTDYTYYQTLTQETTTETYHPTIFGTEHNDILRGDDGDNTIYGEAGNDIIHGEGGNDHLYGGLGSDTIYGEAGHDIIDGGPETAKTDMDIASYTDAPHGIHVEGSSVLDDGYGDTDDLAHIEGIHGSNYDDIIKGVDTSDNDWFIYQGEKGNDVLMGMEPDIFFHQVASYRSSPEGVDVDLEKGIAHDGFGTTDTLHNINTVFGSDFDDTIRGAQDHDNFLEGFKGNDILSGGNLENLNMAIYSDAPSPIEVNLQDFEGTVKDGYGGLDYLDHINGIEGSPWDDVFHLTNSHNYEGTDYIDYVIFPGAGNDHIIAEDPELTEAVVMYWNGPKGVDITLAEPGTPTTVHDPFGGTDILEGIHEIGGTQYTDHLTGNSIGNLFVATPGDDVYDGRGGEDEVDYYVLGEFFHSGIEATLYDADGKGHAQLNGDAANDHSFTHTLYNIEAISGTDFSDILKGDIYDDGHNIDVRLEGNAGNDYLYGGYGNDHLYGEEGSDILEGGPGNNFIDGGISILYPGQNRELDMVSFEHAPHPVDIQLPEAGESAEISNPYGGIDTIENVEGVIGTQFNDHIVGSETFNVLEGGKGDDYIDGGGGQDIISFLHANGPVDVTLPASDQEAHITTVDGTDTIIHIEGIWGSNYDDVLTGNSEDNILDGKGGNDHIYGGGGRDIILASPGNDVIDGGTTVSEGSLSLPSWEWDILSYENSPSGIHASIAEGTATGWGDYVDHFSNIEGIVGSSFNDHLEVGDVASSSTSDTGEDLHWFLFGGDGNDTLIGSDSNDLLVGGNGDDYIDGKGGDDFLLGETGNNVINGGDGIDTLTYWDWVDTLFSEENYHIEVHLDVPAGEQNVIHGEYVDHVSNIEIFDGSPYNDYFYGDSTDNTFIGEEGTDHLYGNGGNDLLIGGKGEDILSGGEGSDRFVYGGGDGGPNEMITDFQAVDAQHNPVDHIVLLTDAYWSSSPNNIEFSYTGTLHESDFATASGHGEYNGSAGDDAASEIVYYHDLSTDTYYLIYDPDGNNPSGAYQVLANFGHTDVGLTHENIVIQTTENITELHHI